MIESISPSRILPPLSIFKKAGQARAGRNPNYSLRLSQQEATEMKLCLSHGVGITDYHQIKTTLAAAQQDLSLLPDLTAELATLRASLSALKNEVQELRLIKEVAEGWSRQMGTNALETEVSQLKDYYEEMNAQQLPLATNDAGAGC